MKTALLALLSSKKVLTALIGSAAIVGAKYGLKVDPEFCYALLGVLAVLLGAQGAADHGKSAAEINQPAPVSAAGEISA